jgi:hypothetical protein
MYDESLSLALAAILLIFVVFYVLYSNINRVSSSINSNNPACFNAPSSTDKYPEVDHPAGLKIARTKWSGLDSTDKTAVMNITKTKLMLGQAPPISLTSTRKLVDHEYGKSY